MRALRTVNTRTERDVRNDQTVIRIGFRFEGGESYTVLREGMSASEVADALTALAQLLREDHAAG